jgi:hypothetical protein
VITSNNEFLEVENFLNPEEQQELINYLCKPNFPWCFTYDAVRGTTKKIVINDDSIVGMFHTFVHDGKVVSPFYDDIKWVSSKFDSVGLGKNSVMRIRAGMFFKHPSTDAHPAHVDANGVNHITAVYYVNDCDGDFYLYEEKNSEHPFKRPLEYTVKKIANPAQGKLVVFNGDHYHASSYPNRSAMRLAITFNFLAL